MPLWKRLWLLVSVIWVVVALLNAGTIIALEEDEALWKARVPLFLALAVPAVLYALLWLWARFKPRKK